MSYTKTNWTERSDTTYKELKRRYLPHSGVCRRGSDTTYKELKLALSDLQPGRIAGSDTTYKELKRAKPPLVSPP